jgi:hypothetical protein
MRLAIVTAPTSFNAMGNIIRNKPVAVIDASTGGLGAVWSHDEQHAPVMPGNRNRDACMSVARKFVAVGAVVGLVLGILVSVTTDVPFAPEGGLLLGALVGWFSRARRHRPLPN